MAPPLCDHFWNTHAPLSSRWCPWDRYTQQGFDSSYSDYGILDDLLPFQFAEDKSLPSVYSSSALCDNQFNDTYLFIEQKNVNAYGEQAS
ncbi:unnamed protein product [Miscanthus lutarioriparius]|uniref:Uncharacterized protein n=1 Tax=Miscanthus lutarioriparius TaxID=422564 RepID=A0A811PIE4_9POAL|nr:unnamed protein product [Miscanthus lutarioriparius]